jgi:hypothetical protein
VYPSEDEDVMLCGEGPYRKVWIANDSGSMAPRRPQANVRMSVLAFPSCRAPGECDD